MAPKELAAAAIAGNQKAAVALEAYADGLARALASLINMIDPDVIVLGGGLSNIKALYDLVPARIPAHTMHSRLDTELLPAVTAPMLVIHGLDDRLITPSGGRRTAELVPGSHLLELADMGHDLPEALWPMVVGAIAAHTSLAVQEIAA